MRGIVSRCHFPSSIDQPNARQRNQTGTVSISELSAPHRLLILNALRCLPSLALLSDSDTVVLRSPWGSSSLHLYYWSAKGPPIVQGVGRPLQALLFKARLST